VSSDAQARAEFDAAYPELVTAAAAAVQRFFRYTPSLVEDALAETMTRTYERWERVRRHENRVGWVVVCAKRVCLEHLRAQTRQARHMPGAAGSESASVDVSERTALSMTIWKALDQLSKRQRDAAVLRYLMEVPAPAVAAPGHPARRRRRTRLPPRRNRGRAPTPTSKAAIPRRNQSRSGPRRHTACCQRRTRRTRVASRANRCAGNDHYVRRVDNHKRNPDHSDRRLDNHDRNADHGTRPDRV
jgi:RNA polymerase sigma factor (sigma-70 family)